MCSNKEGNRLWKSLWVSIVWSIWKHRNRVIFKQAKVDAEEIFTMVQVQSWAWLKHKEKKVIFSFSDWILSPLTCVNITLGKGLKVFLFFHLHVFYRSYLNPIHILNDWFGCANKYVIILSRARFWFRFACLSQFERLEMLC